MSGNTFGRIFRVTTFGESHGEAIGCVVDGCPPGLTLNSDDIQYYLDKRKPGQSIYTSQRKENDHVIIISGTFEGCTTGTPIMLLIQNHDHKWRDYNNIKDLFRPGHADFTYHYKYGIRDYRGGGRASARETAARVASGAIARKYLQQFGIHIYGYLQQIGDMTIHFEDSNAIATNPFFCPNTHQVDAIAEYITAVRRNGDSLGAKIGVRAEGMPIGLGDPIFDKLDATLAFAMMSINAVKGVEIGSGFASVTQLGSEHRDEMNCEGFLSNNAGGILGGISTGQPLEVSLAFKPTASIVKPGKTISIQNEETTIRVTGRHDPCVGIRGIPVAEAMMALVLMDHYLRHRAQNYDRVIKS